MKIYGILYSTYKNVGSYVVFGDWELWIGDWAQSPIPNPQSPIPNPQIILFIY